MKKITTTDQLKLVFKYVLDSEPKDWKRTSIARNAEGQQVRGFKNNKTGETIAVIEREDGYFNIKGTDMEANVRLPVQFLKAASRPTPSVTDQIMDILIKGRKDVPDALLEKADKKDLASRFTFFVVDEPDMGGVMAGVTPKGYDADYAKRAYDVMNLLFPDAEYIDDSVYGLWALEGADTREKLATKLEAAGLEWEADNKAEVTAPKAKPAAKGSKPKR